MFTIGDRSVQVFLATGVTDLRRGGHGLCALVQHELQGDPLSGTIYGFCNRKRDAIKLLLFDSGGLWVCAKRLEQSTFRWPERGDRTVQLTEADLQQLLTGLAVLPPRRVRDRWWQPVPAHPPAHPPSPPVAGSPAAG